MFQLLTTYLLQVKKLPVPALGTFSIKMANAVSDFTSQSVQAPAWTIAFTPAAISTADHQPTAIEAGLPELYDWLTAKLQITKEEAVLRYDNFCSDIRERLDKGENVNWEGLGQLQKIDSIVRFIADENAGALFTPVAAKKIIRPNSSHPILVGEKETTSHERRTRLENDRIPSRPAGTKIAWILLFIALALLAWHFIQNGCNTESIGNKQHIESTKAPETYRLK